MKYPWLKFYTGDWLKDPALSKCEPSTRGIWADLLAAMHESDRSGSISGTYEQLARISRCSVPAVIAALDELSATRTADVTKVNANVTVENRRMLREAKEREATRLRVLKHRGNGLVTGQKSDVRSQSTDQHTHTGQFPTLDQVKVKAQFIGCSEQDAERFWNHFESSGWIDKNGHPIKNWEAKLTMWASDSRARTPEQAHKTAPRDDYWKNSKQLEQVEAEIKAIESRASHTAFSVAIEPKDKERYTQLRLKRKELKKSLGL